MMSEVEIITLAHRLLGNLRPGEVLSTNEYEFSQAVLNTLPIPDMLARRLRDIKQGDVSRLASVAVEEPYDAGRS